MDVYLKDRQSFQTKKLLKASKTGIEYEHDGNSRITVIGTYPGLEGDYIICDDYIGVIDELSPKKGVTEIKCLHPVKLFGREIPNASAASTENLIKTAIETNFKNQSDPLYAIGYLSVSAQTQTTPVVDTEPTDEGYFVLSDYIDRAALLQDVFVSFSPVRSVLNVSISKKTRPLHNVDFADDKHFFVSDNYSVKAVSKITAIDKDTSAETVYYLRADGEITTEQPAAADRARGEWKVVTNANLQKVTEEFKKNEYSHLVEFYSYKNFDVGDNVKFRMKDGRIVSSQISAKHKSSTDNRYFYKAGEMAVTLIEKLKQGGIK